MYANVWLHGVRKRGITMQSISIFLVVMAMSWVALAIHELGHYVAARSLKMAIDGMTIGTGPTIYSWQYRGMWFTIKLFPVSGNVTLVFLSRTRWKNLMVMTAGSLANIVCGLPLLLVSPTLGVISLVMGVCNLIPLSAEFDGAKILKEWRRNSSAPI
jgi:membrane-associated protease RseP (regulator of RpoE activity)